MRVNGTTTVVPSGRWTTGRVTSAADATEAKETTLKARAEGGQSANDCGLSDGQGRSGPAAHGQPSDSRRRASNFRSRERNPFELGERQLRRPVGLRVRRVVVDLQEVAVDADRRRGACERGSVLPGPAGLLAQAAGQRASWRRRSPVRRGPASSAGRGNRRRGCGSRTSCRAR